MKKQINALFKSGRAEKNAFDHPDIALCEISGLQSEMDSMLINEEGFKFKQVRDFMYLDGAPKRGYVSIQRHSVSVEEHTDDVSTGVYFQCYVVSLRTVTETRYDNRPEFRYYDAQGRSNRTRIDEGYSIIFNPRRKHSLIFHGDECTLAIRSVERDDTHLR